MKYDISQSDLGIRNIKPTYIHNTRFEILSNLSDDIKAKANAVSADFNPIKIMETNIPALNRTIDTIHSIKIKNNFLIDKTPVITFQYILKERYVIDFLTTLDSLAIDIIDFVNLKFTLGVNITGGIVDNGPDQSKNKHTGYNEFITETNKFIDQQAPITQSKNHDVPGELKFESIYSDVNLRILSYEANYLEQENYPMLELVCIPENFYLFNKFKVKNGSVKDTNLSAYIPYLFGVSCQPNKVHIEKITNTNKLNSLVTLNNSVLNIIKYLDDQYSFYESKTIINFTVGGELLICSCDNFINKTYDLLTKKEYHQHIALVDDVIGNGFKDLPKNKVLKDTDTTHNFSPAVIMMKNGYRVLAFTRDTNNLMRINRKMNSSIVRALGENEYVSNATTRIGAASKGYSKDPIRINRKVKTGDPKLLGQIDHNLKTRLSRHINLKLNSVDIRPFLVPGYVFKYYVSNTFFDGVKQDEYSVNDYEIRIISDFNGDTKLTSGIDIEVNLYKIVRDAESSDIESKAEPSEIFIPNSNVNAPSNTSNGSTPTYSSTIQSKRSIFPEDYVPYTGKVHSLSKASIERLKMSHDDIKRVVLKMLYKTTDPFIITATHREVSQERLYLRQGRSKTAFSKHLTDPTIAIDLYPYHNGRMVNDNRTQEDLSIWYRMLREIKSSAALVNVPIRQGYNWTHLKDFPHFELDIPSTSIAWPPEVIQLDRDYKNHNL